MANKTVYPYGTGGSLPSSIGLINDLKTGGVDKALTAEQGKVIGEYLFSDYKQVDLSGVTVSQYSLGAGTNSSSRWNANGQHFVIPVTPGDRIRLTVASTDTTGGFYAFFTDYQQPNSVSSATYYLSGGGRVWLSTLEEYDDGVAELYVPITASYLVVCPKDGDRYVSTWTIEKYVEAGISDNIITSDYDIVNPAVSVEVDMSSIDVSSCSLGSSKTWIVSNRGAGKQIVVPVTPGDKLKLYASLSTDSGNYYGWLTSAYTIPSSGDSVPYIEGGNRIWFTDREYPGSGYDYSGHEFTVPQGAAYLCLVTQNGDGDTTVWNVTYFRRTPVNEAIENDVLLKSSVVNSLEKGGAQFPLSAEQGKILAKSIGAGIPDGLTKYTYKGALVTAAEEHKVACAIVSKVTSQSFQGGACYGDYLFMFTENNTTCWMYNLATKSLVQTITIPSEERGFVSNCHCNTVNFGKNRYVSDDPFPVLYVSTGNHSGSYSGAIVYRIVATTENNTTTYSLSLIQTLRIPDRDDPTLGGGIWTEFVIGNDGDCYIIDTPVYTTYRMRLPSLNISDYTFNYSDALEVVRNTGQSYSASGQGRIYRNGKFYMVAGTPSQGNIRFVVFDVATGVREVDIDLLETFGLNYEPEACFVWNEHVCIVFRSHANVYSLYFE